MLAYFQILWISLDVSDVVSSGRRHQCPKLEQMRRCKTRPRWQSSCYKETSVHNELGHLPHVLVLGKGVLPQFVVNRRFLLFSSKLSRSASSSSPPVFLRGVFLPSSGFPPASGLLLFGPQHGASHHVILFNASDDMFGAFALSTSAASLGVTTADSPSICMSASTTTSSFETPPLRAQCQI